MQIFEPEWCCRALEKNADSFAKEDSAIRKGLLHYLGLIQLMSIWLKFKSGGNNIGK